MSKPRITEAIILAGGLGTRLRSAVPELPKCMAPVAGHPFLYHVISYYLAQGITSFIFSLGYKYEIIEAYLKKEFSNLEYEICIEDAPLGTGGAIKKALLQAKTNDVLILNGDTLFKIDLPHLSQDHFQHTAECTLALKNMTSFDRYGVVGIDNEHRVTSFFEKKYYAEGLINGGVYILNKEIYLQKHLPTVHSFEKDFLEKYYLDNLFFGSIHNNYFIDIGIPDDFNKAQKEFQS